MASCRVGHKGVYARLRRAMGGGTALPRGNPIVRRAHQGTLRLVLIQLVGTAYETLPCMERQCHRLCPPYGSEPVI